MSSSMGIAPNVSIRLNSEVYQQACIAVVAGRKTLGQWLEKATRQIANHLGITPAYVSYMASGKRPWGQGLYERYCHLAYTPPETARACQEAKSHKIRKLRWWAVLDSNQ